MVFIDIFVFLYMIGNKSEMCISCHISYMSWFIKKKDEHKTCTLGHMKLSWAYNALNVVLPVECGTTSW